MGEPVFSHTGQRYVLGYGDDFYGIWDRQAPTAPTWRYPRTDEGWQLAWGQYARMEPQAAPVGGPAPTSDMAPGYAAPTTVPAYVTPTTVPAYTTPMPGYAAPMPGYGPVVQKTNGFAIAALVFGIIGGWLLALIFGYVGKSQIDRSGGMQGGRGMAVAGIVLGWVWLGIYILILGAIADSTGV